MLRSYNLFSSLGLVVEGERFCLNHLRYGVTKRQFTDRQLRSPLTLLLKWYKQESFGDRKVWTGYLILINSQKNRNWKQILKIGNKQTKASIM